MRGRCLRWCAVLTCTVAVAGCSAPAPTASGAAAVGAEHARAAVPDAPPEPTLSEADSASISVRATGDLDAMLSRGAVRILVGPGLTDFAIDDQRQSGAAVDAGRAFESFVRKASGVDGSRATVAFISVAPEQLLASLLSGRGDLIAGRFSRTLEREDVVVFSEPVMNGVREVLVTGPGVPPMASLEDVAGRSIHVRRGSDHFASLTRLNGQLAKINKPVCKIVAMDPSLTDEDLLRLVNEGRVPVTLVDQYLAAAWRPVFDKIAVNADVSVSQDGIYAWAVRQDSPRLLALVNEFLRTHDLRGLDTRAVSRWQKIH